MRPQLGHVLQRQGWTTSPPNSGVMPQLSVLKPIGPPELSFVRSSMRALAGAREGCEGCHRTPLVGETVYFFGERMVCELCKPLRARHARRAARSCTPSEHELTVKRRFARLAALFSAVEMDPVTANVLIDRPREEVFDYLADIANHQEFSDHYLKQWRLTRVDSVGRGAGARFKIDAPLDRYGWGDMTFIEVERPHKIVAAGRAGKFNRNKTWTTWTLSPSGHSTTVEVTTESEPALITDKFMEAVTRRRGWMKRRLRKALSRMQSILEEDIDRGKRATVGGL